MYRVQFSLESTPGSAVEGGTMNISDTATVRCNYGPVLAPAVLVGWFVYTSKFVGAEVLSITRFLSASNALAFGQDAGAV